MKKSKSNKSTSHKDLTLNKEPDKKEYIPRYTAPHMIIPAEDWYWSRKQIHSVSKLWQDCWISDPYGSRMMRLNTDLPYSTFMMAKKVLVNAGLFVFKTENSLRDSRETVCWMVQNLHGSRVKSYWERLNSEYQEFKSNQQDYNSSELDPNSSQLESILYETQSQQAFPAPSVMPQQSLSSASEAAETLPKINPRKRSKVNSPQENPGIALNSQQGNNTPLLGDQELLEVLEAARRDIEPTQEVVEQLRNSRYWSSFAPIAQQKGWLIKPTMTSSAKQQVEGLKAESKDPRTRKNPKLQ